MTPDGVDDGSDKPLGHLSQDECLEVRREADGSHVYTETQLGQHDRWLRLAPDLFERYMALVGEHQLCARKATDDAHSQRRLTGALRQIVGKVEWIHASGSAYLRATNDIEHIARAALAPATPPEGPTPTGAKP